MSPTFYVAAKNLLNRRMAIYEHHVFFNIHDDDSYSKFEPTSVTDFKKMTHYGQIIGQEMIFFYLVEMGEDKGEMEARVHDSENPKRIRNTNRLSHSLAKRPLKELRPAYEQEEAKMTKKSSIKKKVKNARRANEAHQLKKFIKKGKIVASTPKGLCKPSTSRTSESETFEPKSTDENLVTNPRKRGLSTSDEDEEQLETKEIHEVGMQAKDQGKAKASTSTATTATETLENNPGSVLLGLKEDLRSLLREELSKINKEVAAPVVKETVNVVEIPMLHGQVVPEGMVHIGDGILVPLEKVQRNVELKSFALRKRVSFMLQTFFPNDFSQRSLDPQKIKHDGKDYIAITKAQVLIMCDLLGKMGWPKGPQQDLSVENVSKLIRKETQRFRDAAKVAAMPEHQRNMLLEQKRQHAKDLRLAAAQAKRQPHEVEEETDVSD